MPTAKALTEIIKKIATHNELAAAQKAAMSEAAVPGLKSGQINPITRDLTEGNILDAGFDPLRRWGVQPRTVETGIPKEFSSRAAGGYPTNLNIYENPKTGQKYVTGPDMESFVVPKDTHDYSIIKFVLKQFGVE